MLSKSEIKAAIEKAPAVADAVKKLASKVARGVRLPETYSVKNLDYDAQRELERLFGTIGQRTPDGRFYISILPIFRERSVWREALEYFGLVTEERDCEDEDIFARFKLLEPDLTPLIESLAADEEVVRFVSKAENRKDWKRLFQSLVERFSSPASGQITTLSQLGSDWFSNSKKLRSGALRRQLFVSSPDQDGVKREIRHSVSLIVIKDENLDVHLTPVVWRNVPAQGDLLGDTSPEVGMTVKEETR